MQDTSFAIHPGTKKTIVGTKYKDIGNILSYEITVDGIHFSCENGFVTILLYNEETVRVIMNQKAKPSLKSSFAVVKEKNDVEFSVEEMEQVIEISCQSLKLKIKKHPFRLTMHNDDNVILAEDDKGMAYADNGEVVCYKRMSADEHFYGFGEKTSFLDKRGEKMEMWNTDVYAPHNPSITALYQSIPFFIGLKEGSAYGVFFDNTFKSEFDLKTDQETYSFKAEGGQLDYYLFVGPTMKEVIKQYTSLTGTMPLPPKWAIGYHQSRYSYETEEEVRELVNNFLEKQIPVDAIYLDIHYMDGYRVFTFDHDRFPDPKGLIEDLHRVGIKVVPIVDPGVKEDPEYPLYQEGVKNDYFCKYLEGNIYFGDVWPGNSAFPDFTSSNVRKWWGEKHKFYSRLGIHGIWNDMNEPAVFNETKTMDIKVMHENDGDPKTHRELHNVYGFLMGEATYEGMKQQLDGQRPFLLTRAGYAGVQRYSAVWTGDNRSFWEHLELSIPMCMNMGLSGVAFCGPDIGGFAHDATGQLLIRWMQMGTFTPYFRNHSGINSVRQEPWSFGEKVELLTKKYIEQRYIWLPYLYTLFHEASETGLPIMRPLVLEYPSDHHTFNLSDQFMLGEDVIVAPITRPDTFHRIVYLPEGQWINYWTDELFEGSKHHLVEAPLDILPIFIKQGAIIPHGSIKQSTQVEEQALTLHIYAKRSGNSTYTMYEDDGKTFGYEKGNFNKKEITCHFSLETMTIDTLETVNGYTPTWKELHFVIHDMSDSTLIIYNGIEVSTDEIKYCEMKRTLSFVQR